MGKDKIMVKYNTVFDSKFNRLRCCNIVHAGSYFDSGHYGAFGTCDAVSYL